jgi:cation transport protein ChaC
MTLIFVADHGAEIIQPNLPRETQIEYLATGSGILGSSADYIRGVVQKLEALGIEDPDSEALLRDVEARIEALK